MDDETIDLGVASGQVRLIDVEEQTPETILAAVDEFLQGDASVPARICIASLGSALWGGVTAEVQSLTINARDLTICRLCYDFCICFGRDCADIHTDVLPSALQLTYRVTTGAAPDGCKSWAGLQMAHCQ